MGVIFPSPAFKSMQGHQIVNTIGTMPNPTEEELKSDEFNVIWEVIKTWQIWDDKLYNGVCSANGSHVKIILNALKQLHDKKFDKKLMDIIK